MLGTSLGPLPGPPPAALAPVPPGARRRCSTPPLRPSACLPATCGNSIARRSSWATRSSTRTGSRRRPRWPTATAWARCSTLAPVRAATSATGAAVRRSPGSPRSACSCASASRAASPTGRPAPTRSTAIRSRRPPCRACRPRPRCASTGGRSREPTPTASPTSLRRPHLVLRPPRATAPSRPDCWRRPGSRRPWSASVCSRRCPSRTCWRRADPDDRDGDGISGRPNWVPDRSHGQRRVGRFGWKAEQPSVLQQAAAAFVGDMGITSALFPQREPHPAPERVRPAAPAAARPRSSDAILRQVAPTSACWACPRARRPGPGGAARGGAVSIGRLRPLPRPAAADRRGRRPARAGRADHLALHRPVAARHGRRARGRAPGVRGGRPGVAHAAAVGPGAGRNA